ncbi:hypothetical protein [Gordonia jinhuaensis]|uniref:hypothetical protein n=1 Tax=Gordonia jinhuaensis TaxID=1517702 RepID=UPI0016643A90|nr:hypothetical protein [Gordonia jinhuaensis]
MAGNIQRHDNPVHADIHPGGCFGVVGRHNAVLAANLQRPQDDTTSEVVVTVEDTASVAQLDAIDAASEEATA